MLHHNISTISMCVRHTKWSSMLHVEFRRALKLPNITQQNKYTPHDPAQIYLKMIKSIVHSILCMDLVLDREIVTYFGEKSQLTYLKVFVMFSFLCILYNYSEHKFKKKIKI